MTTIALLPLDYTLAPSGVLHLKRQHPEAIDTLCGLNVLSRKDGPWVMGDETQRGTSATCLPCRSAAAQTERDSRLGNEVAMEGCDRCECGCKYWADDRCIDCGADWTPECRGED